MINKPKTVEATALAAKALQLMEKHSITSLVIVSQVGNVEGVIHLHDILRSGIA
jgi:arabinose-5-phosphate isomerase